MSPCLVYHLKILQHTLNLWPHFLTWHALHITQTYMYIYMYMYMSVQSKLGKQW